MKFRMLLMAASLTVFMVGNATAGTVLFLDRSAFLSNLEEVFSEGFEDVTSVASPVFDSGIFTLTSSPQAFGSASRGAFPSLVSEGSTAITFSERTTLTLTFETEIRSIGFDINELNSSSMSYADNAGNLVMDAVLANTQNTTFFGLSSDTAFSVATLAFSGRNSSVAGFDNLQFSTGPIPILAPIPGSIMLIISAFSLFGLLKLKKIWS